MGMALGQRQSTSAWTRRRAKLTNSDETPTAVIADVDAELVTLAADIDPAAAENEIGKAVRGRRGIARTYVRWVRRRNPDASPAEVVALLERHYVTAISAAGAAIAVGTIAAEVGIAMIPVAGAAAAGTKAVAKQAGKQAAKEATKAAVKSVALGAAKSGSTRALAMLPAGDEQFQFEITAVFALALADIHGLELDQAQSQALVYGLSNGRVSQQQIAKMAKDLASAGAPSTGVAHAIAGGRNDWGHWANTLADALPAGAAQDLVRGVQTGALEGIRETLDGKQQAAVDYGVGALVGGVTRFVFGRDVVDASRAAFAEAPDAFPEYLAVAPKDEPMNETPNRALEALTDAAKSLGAELTARAIAVGSGAAAAADTVSRPFRSVDLDGDGIADEAQALTVARDVGGAIAGRAGAVGGFLAGSIKKMRKERQEADADD